MLAPSVVLFEIDATGFAIFELERDAPRSIDMDRIALRIKPLQRMKIEARNVHFLGLDGDIEARQASLSGFSYSGNSGSPRALRLAAVAAGDVVERTKLQRTEGAGRASCRITIWAVRRGPAFPARNTLASNANRSLIDPQDQS